MVHGALKWNVGAEEKIETEIVECRKGIEGVEKEAGV
jgi:hypothetical protein